RRQRAGQSAQPLQGIDRIAAVAEAHPGVLPPGPERLEQEMVGIEVPRPRREIAAMPEPVVGDEADRDEEEDGGRGEEPEQGVEPVRPARAAPALLFGLSGDHRENYTAEPRELGA